MTSVAIAALETSSIAQGMVVADAMVKTADVDVLEASSLSPGRFWVLIGGDVAPVRASHRRGLEIAADTRLDDLFIPQLDPGVLAALRGLGRGAPPEHEALGVIETLTASAAILAADVAVKAADVRLVNVRLANGIGGKGVVTLSGRVSAVQAAVAAGREDPQRRGMLARHVVIPRLDARLRSRFL